MIKPQKRRNSQSAVAVPEGIRAEAGKPLLTGSPEADRSPPLLDLIARLLHRGEKFRGDLSGIEGLADLIAQHILALLLLPACHGLVAGLCQKDLSGHRGRVALISGYVFPALCLFRVFPIVQTVTDGLGYTLALVGMVLLVYK